MNIDHIGIVVPSIDEAIAHWESVFGYKQYTNKVENSRQRVYVVFLKKNGSLPIKLLEPTDKSSPVYVFAKRGGGIHHLCFRCRNIHTEIERIKDLGLRVLTLPEPGEAFENESIAFFYAKQGISIEIIDTDKRASIIR